MKENKMDRVKALYKEGKVEEKIINGQRIINFQGTTYEVQGTERIRLIEQGGKICEICGKPFTPSKFTPYLTRCPNCKTQSRRKYIVLNTEKPCATCGEIFDPGKFNMYLTDCPSCREAKAKEVKMSKRIASLEIRVHGVCQEMGAMDKEAEVMAWATAKTRDGAIIQTQGIKSYLKHLEKGTLLEMNDNTSTLKNKKKVAYEEADVEDIPLDD